MNSKIKFYNVDFTPEKNALVDDFPNFIENFALGGPEMDIQFIKDLDLDLTITVYQNQNQFKSYEWNYARITQENRYYYFFILGTNWKAQETLELVLSMDTLNTFYWNIMEEGFTEQTLVMRQHADRFYKPSEVNNVLPDMSYTLYGAIDNTDESLGGLIQFNHPEENYVVGDSKKWYLIYATDYTTSTDPKDIKPISCYLCADSSVYIVTPGSPKTITVNSLPPDGQFARLYCLTDNDNYGETIQADSTNYVVNGDNSYMFYRYQGKLRLIRVNNKTSEGVPIGDFDSLYFTKTKKVKCVSQEYGMPNKFVGTSGWRSLVINSADFYYINAGSGSAYISGIDEVDRTKTNLLKIIELPYAPVKMEPVSNGYSLPLGWAVDGASGLGTYGILLLKLNNLNTDFGQVISSEITCINDYYIPSVAEGRGWTPSLHYEPKMLNSQFHTEKFVYDSFSKEIKAENLFNYNVADDDFKHFNIYFKPSNSINSNMLFDFQISPDRSEGDYENIMICQRNNELPLYNSDYLNYLRNGYNYDIKNRNRTTVKNLANYAIGAAVGTIGFLSGVATGGLGAVAGAALGANVITSSINTISNELQADRDQAQKLDDLRVQASSVQGSDDLNLLNYYNGNKLIRATYDLSDNTYNNVQRLFEKTGYAVNAYLPVDVQSRRCYNFIQCDPVFVEHGASDWKEFEDDVIARFKIGVTVYHPFKTNANQDFMYDFDQYHENWETWICPRDLVF